MLNSFHSWHESYKLVLCFLIISVIHFSHFLNYANVFSSVYDQYFIKHLREMKEGKRIFANLCHFANFIHKPSKYRLFFAVLKSLGLSGTDVISQDTYFSDIFQVLWTF